MTRLVVALVLAVAVLGGWSAVAGAATPKTTFEAVEPEVMCDTCNVALNIAESPRADQQRREIRGLIDQGLTKQQVLDELERRYGSNVLARPDAEGFNLAVWLVPLLLGGLLIAALVVTVPRWRRRGDGNGIGDGGGPEAVVARLDGLDSADARRLEADLARYTR